MQRAKKYTLEQVAALLPWPDDLANKYSRGKLTLIAGCADYPGAACLAAVASQRMGAGYTEVACSPESVAAVRAASRWQTCRGSGCARKLGRAGGRVSRMPIGPSGACGAAPESAWSRGAPSSAGVPRR